MSIPPDEFSRLLHQPLLDTLFAITGKPRKIAQQPISPGAVGKYSMGRDSVSMSPNAFEGNLNQRPVGEPAAREPDENFRSPERILSHELGHRMFLGGDVPLADPARVGMQRTRDSVEKAGGRLPGYSGTNPDEHEAEAFANAIQFLRYTSSAKPAPDTRKSLDGLRSEYDKSVPGTSYMIDYLLKQPVFAHHPLNTSAEIHNPAPDATAVRLPVVGSLTPGKPPLRP